MKEAFVKPFTLNKLSNALKALSFGKAPSLDGIIAKFYKQFWDLMKVDYLVRINKALANKKSPPGITSGLITLIFKSEERNQLSN